MDKYLSIIKGIQPGLFIARDLSQRKMSKSDFARSIGFFSTCWRNSIKPAKRAPHLSGHRPFYRGPYGSVDLLKLFSFLQYQWPYFDTLQNIPVGMGKTAFIGYEKKNCVKVDIYYTDHFINNYHLIEGIRLATVEEIIAMKMEVISDKGRKKDFGDIHELIEDYSFIEMLDLHNKRYPYTHDHETLISNFTNFKAADDDLEPYCLRNKVWELIKIDLIDFSVNKL